MRTKFVMGLCLTLGIATLTAWGSPVQDPPKLFVVLTPMVGDTSEGLYFFCGGSYDPAKTDNVRVLIVDKNAKIIVDAPATLNPKTGSWYYQDAGKLPATDPAYIVGYYGAVITDSVKFKIK